jgi:hypothetical protein
MPQPRPSGAHLVPVRSAPGGDPPPYEPPVPPDPDETDRDDDIPDTPGTEPPPVPIRDPRPEGAPTGPYIA